MAEIGRMAVRVDEKGRVTLPKKMREALGIVAGDAVFLKYESNSKQVRLARASSPFDLLAEQAVKGVSRRGHTDA